MDKVLRQLRKRFIATFVAIGGLFLLLSYGTIFAVNIVQTDIMIQTRLESALARVKGMPVDDDEMQSVLARSSCMLLVSVSDMGHDDDRVFFLNADDVDAKTKYDIEQELLSSEEDSNSFKVDGRYMRSRRMISLGAQGERIEVHSVYDWSSDRLDLIGSGVTTCAIYLSCMVLLYLFGQLVSRQMISPVKQSYEQQKQLVADASHELKTPIAIIGANMYLIQSDPDATVKENDHWIESINAQLSRMSALITDMLELYKAEAVNSVVKTDRNLSEMIDGVLLSFEARCFEKSIELEQNIAPGVVVHCSAGQIEKLWNILMDNALKYTPQQGKISVELKADKRNVYASFTNFGAGIAKEHVEKIFDRFYRIDNARTQNDNSFGLGLSLAKNIALNHDGEIRCESDGESYTKFIVRLPKSVVGQHLRRSKEKSLK